MLLLEYMDGQLYGNWKLHSDEPWNGPHNSKLKASAPEFFRCPSDRGPASDTSYVAVVGPGTIWPGTSRVSQSQITDGLSNTVIVVEVANSGINWMEPRDLDFVNRAPGINAKSGLGVRSRHPLHACVLYADGSASAPGRHFRRAIAGAADDRRRRNDRVAVGGSGGRKKLVRHGTLSC